MSSRPSNDFRLRLCRLLAGIAGIVLTMSHAMADSNESLHRQIDRLVASFPATGELQSASDAEFVRRVTLDLTGQIPSATLINEYLSSAGGDRKSAYIERLLSSPAYARHLQQVFDSWLMQRRRERHIPADQWQSYLRESFAQNKSWEQLATEILSSDGSEPGTRAAARFYLDRECSTDELARDIGAIFLGRNLRCAQCHDHPIVPDYKQADYFGIAAFVDRSFLFDDKVSNRKLVAEKPTGETAFTSALSQVRGVTLPRILNGPALLDPTFDNVNSVVVAPAAGTRPMPVFSRRAQLPSALVRHPAFSRNMANRLWALMFGPGIVDPVDQDHEGNPPVYPELLDLLSDRFVAMKYDLREFLRELALTELYSRECTTNLRKYQTAGTPTLALPLRKLTPEQLVWSWLQASGQIEAESQAMLSDLKTMDPKMLAMLDHSPAFWEMALHDRLSASADQAIKVFVTSLPGEAPRSETTAGQALYLLNGPTLRKWIEARPGNLLDQLLHASSDDQIAQDLFLHTVSRRPEPPEVNWVRETLATTGSERAAVIADLIESLLTSTEFRFNH